jgi:ferredoxin-NADP reductase/DMSO/TMAO reductase YedYZ heme-binding membrane subunit
MTDPHLWWYVTRASALVAWGLMTFSVIWGILLSTRLLRRVDNPGWLRDIHGYVSGLAVIMVLLHMLSLMLDGWLKFSIAEVLVPFDAHYRNTPVALGIVAFYLLVGVQVTSMMLHRLPRRFWKAVHYSSYVSLILVSFHAGLTGTDVGSPWYRVLSVALIVLAAGAIIVRVIAGRSVAAPQTARAAGTAATSSPPAAETTQVERAGTPALPEGFELFVVSGRRIAAEGVIGLRFVSTTHSELPVWTPGSHITLHLPGGLQRQYSLCGDPADRTFYEISVLRSPTSTGGSDWIHDNLVPGMAIPISGPANHFELLPAPEYRFIAGGIGITPIRAMIESLPDRRDWRLLYLGRSRRSMAFASELEFAYPGRVFVFARDEQQYQVNLAGFVAGSDPLVYACGPESLMQTVSDLVAHERIHFERFRPIERLALNAARPVDVTCRKSRKQFVVEPGANILEAMEENGVPVLGSCRKGVCGSCEVRVVSGTLEHLDSVQEDAVKDELSIMYPCVSRGTSSELVLDV